jgi:subtilisin-like proprotein convertase family protein
VGSGDDTVNGQWTLHITDTVAGETGVLLGWSVYLLSNWD